MQKYTKTTLKKVELLCKEAGYTIRYEKGQFQPGYCILESKKVIVVNKFLSTDARVATLIEMFDKLNFNLERLSIGSRSFLEVNLNKKVEQH